jgi:hypothetical protein
MKRTASIAGKTLAFGIALVAFAVVPSLSAAVADQGAAKVIRIEGAARFSDGNNVWKPLHVGDVLRPGVLIQTASHSQVDMILSDKGGAVRAPAGTAKVTSASPRAAQEDVVRMTENTLLAIDKLLVTRTGADVVKETELDLRSGKIFGSVKKLTGASKYEVKIPNGVAGIRGTIYSISASGVLSVWEGQVILAVVRPDGTIDTKVVNEGEQFDPATNQVTPVPAGAMPPEFGTIFTPATHATYTTTDRTIEFVSPTLGSDAPSEGEFFPQSKK